MMGVNILNMRGSLNGVWAAEMTHQQKVSNIIETFKKTYRYGEDPNEIMSNIIDNMNMADELTDLDYDYINETATTWFRGRYR